MNIMFVLKSYDLGGVEVVTSVLANRFISQGHNICIYAFAASRGESIVERLDKRIHCYTLKHLKYNEENVCAMRAVMVEENIQIVINQWGLPFYPLKTVKHASKGLNIKVISVYHNTPDMNGRIQEVENQITFATSSFKKAILSLKRRLFKEITAYSMRWNYSHSDVYMVLSPSFIKIFQKFTGLKHTPKLMVQTNPVTIETPCEALDDSVKRKEVVYVGRIDCNQKRIERIITMWSQIESTHQDWVLTIVGDGPDRSKMEELVEKLSIKNISFEGFKNPVEYYKRASLLLLTSDFEGFPLVLAECMSFGVVPIVYGSYSAVYDIIKDKENGRILPPKNGQFIAEDMANILSEVMTDSDNRDRIAINAIETSKGYSIDLIYEQWNICFQKLVN